MAAAALLVRGIAASFLRSEIEYVVALYDDELIRLRSSGPREHSRVDVQVGGRAGPGEPAVAHRVDRRQHGLVGVYPAIAILEAATRDPAVLRLNRIDLVGGVFEDDANVCGSKFRIGRKNQSCDTRYDGTRGRGSTEKARVSAVEIDVDEAQVAARVRVHGHSTFVVPLGDIVNAVFHVGGRDAEGRIPATGCHDAELVAEVAEARAKIVERRCSDFDHT